MRKYLIIATGVLLFGCFLLLELVAKQHKEISRLSNNQEALMTMTQHYKTKSGLDAAYILELELTKSELECNCADLKKHVDDLNIKLKRVQSISATGSTTDVKVQTVVRDSLVYVDRVIKDSMKVFTWQDPWTDIRGVIRKDSLDMDVSCKDTIIQVLHRVPKKFLFFKYGTKHIEQVMVSTNPHTQIVYSKFVKLK